MAVLGGKRTLRSRRGNDYVVVPMRTVRTFDSPDKKRRVIIIEREDGAFSWVEEVENTEDMSDYGLGVSVFWCPTDWNGIFGSADEAEREARAATPWMRGG